MRLVNQSDQCDQNDIMVNVHNKDVLKKLILSEILDQPAAVYSYIYKTLTNKGELTANYTPSMLTWKHSDKTVTFWQVYLCTFAFPITLLPDNYCLLFANPSIKDITDCTPLDYASEKQLNYCALLLSNAQQSGEVGSV